MVRDVIITIMAILLMGLIMGKAVVSALTHIIAKLMTWLADRGTFRVSNGPTYEEFYAAHSGEVDIEH